MRALDRKLARDLWRARAQAVTVALVVACGIISYVAMASTYASLGSSRDAYYERTRFADVFDHARRAPAAVADRIAALPGVAQLEARVVEDVLLDMPALPEPAVGRLVSLPPAGEPLLCAVHVREGRLPEPGRADEVLVSEPFARAHGLGPGSHLDAVIHGRLQKLRVVGVGLSPEYVYSVAPGELVQDDRRFAALWAARETLDAAFDMHGAFNDVVIRLSPGASEAAVRDGVDRLLGPYGGVGAYGRDRQMSDRFLSGEIKQLRGMAAVVPALFLFVAAFLSNVVLSRMVSAQREQVAALKALGYSNLAVGWHYARFVLAIVLSGSVLGVAGGAWLGSALTRLYAGYFRLPVLTYRLDPRTAALAALASVAAGVAGALFAVRRAVSLPPAEAMRSEAPVVYRRTLLEKLGLFRWLAPATRMVARDVLRAPLRLVFSAAAISLALAILVVGRFSTDAIDHLIDVQFQRAEGEDLTLAFRDPVSARAAAEVAHLPGVREHEALHVVPARVSYRTAERTVAIAGLSGDGPLRRLFDVEGNAVALPSTGLLMSARLASVLGVRVGERVRAEVLEGERPVLDVPVAGLVEDLNAQAVYMRAEALERALGEAPSVSAVMVTVDPLGRGALMKKVRELPAVASVSRRDAMVEYFRRETAGWMLVYTLFLTAFASVVAVGVVYNNARVALALRSRDLASLRVLGFTRAEVSSVLLAEQAVQVALAIGPGLALGRAMAAAVLATADPELFVLPVVIAPRTYAYAVTVVLLASAASALAVRRRVNSLDMVAVLKARD